ncbi:PREDICTED: uncharacterized protein LOC104825078 [Tarenaya hassleriana]|uniref:uncharacterized protein LOC104825078 n=1 Tax=Tarenaya hassleriana TaxID=28532 RepID=UPI00053C3F07|nr:PREDICTED: uncharacterized protein LOC104825078 [Tarenaya hassleriana]
MSWYRRTKLFLVNSRRNTITPRISPVSPSSTAFSIIHRQGSSNLSAKFSGFSISCRRSGLSLCNSLGNTNINASNRFLSISKKLDRVGPFKPPEPRGWFQNPVAVLAVVFAGSWVLVTVCDLETVPYTKRRHFVIWSKSIEKWFGETSFQMLKFRCKWKILPADRPESIRVKSIVKDIIEGMQRSLSLESVRYASMDGSSTENDGSVKDAAMGLSENFGKGTMSGMKGSEDDIWIQQSRKKSKEKGSQPMISHLEGLNWEVLVVKGPAATAYCYSSGKIVVYTGLLEHLRTDAEIATVIGHEIGSLVARHMAEETSKFCLTFPFLVLCMVFTGPLLAFLMSLQLTVYSILLMEELIEEADNIGLILQAIAGYDPRAAPGAYEKLGRLEYDSSRVSPYAKPINLEANAVKRAQRLVHSKTMEEALSIYQRQAQSGFGGVGV